MTKKELYQKVIEYFQATMPVAETELHYTTPFELLVAVILSAQCTDKRVNQITPALFLRLPHSRSYGCSHSWKPFTSISKASAIPTTRHAIWQEWPVCSPKSFMVSCPIHLKNSPAFPV